VDWIILPASVNCLSEPLTGVSAAAYQVKTIYDIGRRDEFFVSAALRSQIRQDDWQEIRAVSVCDMLTIDTAVGNNIPEDLSDNKGTPGFPCMSKNCKN